VFGPNNFGQIEETYPALGDYALKFDTVALYKVEYFEQFGFSQADIMYFNKPLLIQLTLNAPDPADIRILTFAGVWFQNNPTAWDAEADDLLVTREINAKASRVIPQ
jgi:hypothetical protein